MVLQGQPCGRVGRCRGFEGPLARVGLLLFRALIRPQPRARPLPLAHSALGSAAFGARLSRAHRPPSGSIRGGALRGGALRGGALRGAVLRGAVLRGAALRGSPPRGSPPRGGPPRGSPPWGSPPWQPSAGQPSAGRPPWSPIPGSQGSILDGPAPVGGWGLPAAFRAVPEGRFPRAVAFGEGRPFRGLLPGDRVGVVLGLELLAGLAEVGVVAGDVAPSLFAAALLGRRDVNAADLRPSGGGLPGGGLPRDRLRCSLSGVGSGASRISAWGSAEQTVPGERAPLRPTTGL
jgi:hypothetical protein